MLSSLLSYQLSLVGLFIQCILCTLPYRSQEKNTAASKMDFRGSVEMQRFGPPLSDGWLGGIWGLQGSVNRTLAANNIWYGLSWYIDIWYDVVYDFFMMNVSFWDLCINYMICCMVYVFIQGNHISRDARNPNIPQSKQVCNMHFFAYGFPISQETEKSSLDHPQSSNTGLESNVVSVPSQNADQV